ncbi:MAG: phosphatase [Clostridia bacterium]|nr:phosphatase [Lachnospiraceae bacterium]NCC01611.1 phosphatase [Clostridia bacterium]NCD02368.1 phosphatase [Clostridia bacterium]
MKIDLDTHTHTLASGHAYNTITEMISAAAEKDLKLLAITEHAPAMPGSCKDFYFYNLKILPRFQKGLEIMFGVELNVMDYKGHLDLPEKYIECTDLRIASLHPPCLKPGTVEENTAAMLATIHNPYVDILGHPDDGRYPMDYERVIAEAKKYGKIVELNNNSMSPLNSRTNARENDRIILDLCEKYEVPVVMASDSHADFMVGDLTQAEKLVEEVHFPKELVLNDSVEKFKKYLNLGRNKGRL